MPVLALKAFRIKRLHVESKDSKSPGKSDNNDMTFSWATAQEKDDPFIRVLTFGIKTSSVLIEGRPIPEIDVLIDGKFHLAADTPEDKLEEILLVNGSTILYGALRGLLAGLSGAFSGGQLMLPTVDMVEIVQEMLKDQQANIKPKRSGTQTQKNAAASKASRQKTATAKKKKEPIG